MHLGRFNLFSCDSCQKQEYADPFPPGWIFVTSLEGTKHQCRQCVTPEAQAKCDKQRQDLRKNGATVHQ